MIQITNISDLLSLNMEKEVSIEFLRQFTTFFNDETKEVIEPIFRFNSSIVLDTENLNYFNIKEKEFETTIGRFIFNKFVFPKEYFEIFPFINDTINKSNHSLFINNMNSLLLEKLITSEMFSDFIDKFTWIGFTLTNFKGYSINLDSIYIPDSIKKRKEELIKQYSDKDGNINEDNVLKIENELLTLLKQEKKNSGLFKIIDSGSKGDFKNNYKNLLLFRGLIKDKDGMKFINSNLFDGNSKDSYLLLSNNSIQGSYGRSVKTAQGGYLTKLITSGFSSLALTDNDCKSNVFLKVEITSSNINKYMNRYFTLSTKTPDKLILLNLKNKNEYIGKTLYFRSVMYCHSKGGLCKKCFGDLWKVNNIEENLSVLISEVTSRIMNVSMKSFHNLTIDYDILNYKKILTEQK